MLDGTTLLTADLLHNLQSFGSCVGISSMMIVVSVEVANSRGMPARSLDNYPLQFVCPWPRCTPALLAKLFVHLQEQLIA
jgi:hypothetical protein